MFTQRIKHCLATIAVLFCSLAASAYTAYPTVGGIAYTYDLEKLTAAVSYLDYDGCYNPAWDGPLYYEYYNDKYKYSDTVVIPSTVTYNGTTYSVTSIKHHAFYGCSSLTSITIPESVTSIEDEAFYGCSSLTSITIPESVTSIGRSAFSGCRSLTSITIPEGVTSIGYGTFEDCRSLTAINIPENSQLTSIGDRAFSNCSGLASITIPASVTSIGYGVLMGCSQLTTITVEEGNTEYDSRNGCNAIIKTSNNTLVSGCSTTVIPEGVTSIGNRAFGYCNFTTIIIPKGVTNIGDYAFGYCSNLTFITLPESMTAVGTGAFIGCRKLAELTSLATTPPTLGSATTFSNVDKAIPVYVPAGSIEAYKSAAYWNEFTNILPISEPAPIPSTVSITINQYGSGTYSSEYALDFSEVAGLKAYVATGYNHLTGEVTLLRVRTAEAGTGLLIKGATGVEYKVPIIESTADHTLNMLVATLGTEKTPVNSLSDDGKYANYKYTVKAPSTEPLFYQFADNSNLSAGKAYLQIPVAWLPATETRVIRYRFDEGEGEDDTTSIDNSEFRNQNSEIIYDLMGRRVLEPKKGEMYIIDGRKVIY